MKQQKLQTLEELLFDFYYELRKQNRLDALMFLKDITEARDSRLKMLKILVKYQSNLEQSA